jgi:hypothetical protein
MAEMKYVPALVLGVTTTVGILEYGVPNVLVTVVPLIRIIRECEEI